MDFFWVNEAVKFFYLNISLLDLLSNWTALVIIFLFEKVWIHMMLKFVDTTNL